MRRLALLAVALGAPVMGQTFTLLAPPDGYSSGDGRGISANGLYVAGDAVSNDFGNTVAIIWNGAAAQALTVYGDNNRAFGVANSGLTLCGEADYGAQVWRLAGPWDIPIAPGSGSAVTPDGTLVVGYRTTGSGSSVGFAYAPDSGAMIDLPPLGDDTDSFALAVTPGGIVAGYSAAVVGPDVFNEAVVWVGGVPAALPAVNGYPLTVAQGISADGSVAVGFAGIPESYARPVRWANGAAEFLDPVDEFGNAWAVSADGNTVVGEGFNGAFIWTPSGGYQYVADVLTGAGVDLTSRALTRASAISADGGTIVGTGLSLDDSTTFAWVVNLPLPCPADYDQNTFVNGDDFDQFSYDFYFGYSSADVNHDGFVNGDDFDYFVAHFDAGC